MTFWKEIKSKARFREPTNLKYPMIVGTIEQKSRDFKICIAKALDHFMPTNIEANLRQQE